MLALAPPPAPGDPLALTSAGIAQEEPEDGEKRSRWVDPEDGWFDLSSFREHPHGFIPLVVPITQPAVGYGAAGAPVCTRGRRQERKAFAANKDPLGGRSADPEPAS